MAADDAGQPVVYWQEAKLAVLTKGKNLLHPEIKFDRALKDISPENSKKAEERIKQWVETMKAKHLEGLVKIDALANDANNASFRARSYSPKLSKPAGIIVRRQIDQAVRALDNDMRGVARRGGLVFGALDIFHHALMKPGAVLWRNALFAALDEQPMIALPGDNAVHLKDWKFATPDHASRLGFRKIGGEYIRVDMAERLVKQAHEARQAGTSFRG